MRDKGQVFIFNDEELSVIKNTFADDEALLYSIRKVFLQFPLTPAEREYMKLSITDAVWKILKKRILPEIGDEFPIGQLPSILTTLTEQMKVNNAEEMIPHLAAKKLEIDYLEERFEALRAIMEGREEATPRIVLADLGKITPDTQQTYVNLQAYLFLLGYIDPMLNFIKSIAGAKSETAEEQKKRMTRDSSK